MDANRLRGHEHPVEPGIAELAPEEIVERISAAIAPSLNRDLSGQHGSRDGDGAAVLRKDLVVPLDDLVTLAIHHLRLAAILAELHHQQIAARGQIEIA